MTVNAERRERTPWVQAVLSTFLSAVIVFLVIGILNWVWVLTHEPESGQGRLSYFLYCMLMSSAMIGFQFVVLLVAAVIISLVRGRHNRAAGILAGVLLVVIDILAAGVRFLPDTTARYLVYCFGFPVLVSLLQWWPARGRGSGLET